MSVLIYNGTDHSANITGAQAQLSDGTLIAAILDATNDDIMFFYSDDDGDTWTDTTDDITDAVLGAATTPTQAAFTIDADDNLWCVYEESGNGYGKIRRGVYSSGSITWDSGYDFYTAYTYAVNSLMTAVAFKIGTDEYIGIAFAHATISGDPYFGIVKRTSGGTYSVAKAFANAYSAGSLIDMKLDFHHTGDGVTVSGSAPHIYLYWQESDRVRFKKYTYSTGPSWSAGTLREISGYDTSVGSYPGDMIYDGTRIVMVYPHNSSPYYKVVERNEVDTATTWRTTGSPPVATSPYPVILFFDVDKNIHMAHGRGHTSGLSHAQWTRGTDTWDSSWTLIEAVLVDTRVYAWPYSIIQAAVVRSDLTNDDVYITEILSYNEAPTAPTWNNTTGQVEDVAETLALDWNFNDLDGDPQSDYTVRRRKGAAAYAYWNGTSWQASEDASTKIASSVSSKTLSASWGADGDDDHYYAIKTWDPSDEVSPWSSELRVIPSAQDNPTITAPTGTVGPTATATWTVTTQTAYRVVVSDTSSTSDMDAGTLDYDSGWIVDAAKTALIEFPTNSVTRYFRVQTKNDEGLISDIDQETLTVSYTPPTEPTLTVSEVVDGALRITIDNPAGGQTVESNDVYRRIGTGDYIRRATGVAVDGTWDDWAVTGGVTYDYKVRALGDNGTWTEGSTVT